MASDDPNRPRALQNRVLPTAEIVADPARGTLMGNRGGALHDIQQRLGRARWRSRAWICCVLRFQDRHRQVMAPGRYTELFFLDEATALAAGHRPCAECRRADYNAFRDAWQRAHGQRPLAPEIDVALHNARIAPDRTQLWHSAPMSGLPDGTFVWLGGRPCLIWREALHPYSPAGYGKAIPRPDGIATVLTPAPTLAVLAAGYRPAVHPLAAVA